MGETDMGSQAPEPGAQYTEPELQTTATDEKSTADWAGQRRAEARAALDPPKHFDTPAWMGPTHGTETFTPQVPAQPEPSHDTLHVFAPSPAAEPMPETAHWVEHRKPRVFVGVVLTLALIGAIASLAFAIVNQSVTAVVVLVVCVIFAVIFRGALMSSAVTTVDLKGSTLRVRKGASQAVCNLADPSHRVEVLGTPGSPDWQVILEATDGRDLVLTAANVDPVEFHRIATHYRVVAERERQNRLERFNR